MKLKEKLSIILGVITIVFFLITSSLMLIRETSLDDLGFLRFSSYAFFDKNSVEEIRHELSLQKEFLPPDLFVKHGLRLDAIYYYPLLTCVIRIFDSLPHFFPFQSVIMTFIFFQLISFLILLTIVTKKYNKSFFHYLIFSLILSLIPWKLLLWKIHLPIDILPFNLTNMLWFNGTAKNSILIIFLAILLLLFKRKEIKKGLLKFSVLSLFIAALLLNYPFTLMLLVIASIVFLIQKHLHSAQRTAFSLFISFITMSFLFGLFKLFISPSLPNAFLLVQKGFLFFLFHLTLASVIIFLCKKQINKAGKASLNESERWINFIFPLFFIFASMALGFSMFPNDPALHYTDNKWLTGFWEISNRVNGPAHMFFWLLVGFILIEKIKRHKRTEILIAIFSVLAIFLQISIQTRFFKANSALFKNPATIKTHSQKNIYLNEKIFYKEKLDKILEKNNAKY